MRLAIFAIVLGELLISTAAMAQDAPAPSDEGNAVCTFADDKQISVRYKPQAYDKKHELPLGKLWEPGDEPMALFTETALTIAKTDLVVGAYSLYLVPGKDTWTLVVNKNVTAGSKYDQQQDIVRAPMESGKLPREEPQFSVYFGHTAPKQCSMRVDFGKTRAWVDFNEK